MLTALDLQEIGLRYVGGNVTDAAIRDVRLAARLAVQEVAKEYLWPYYVTQQKLALQAPQTTGTVAYTASTRQFTLSGGTWPADAAYGQVRVGYNVARIVTRNSATVVTIEEHTEFRDNLAAGTTYTYYQDEYALDTRFHKMSRAFVDRIRFGMSYKDPMTFTKERRPFLFTSNTPMVYTVYGDRNRPGQWVMAFHPMPNRAMTVTFSGVRFPAELSVWDEHAGVVAVTAADATVTGTATAFDSSLHPDCVIRLSRNRLVPTSPDGDNRYADESIVASVASPTSLEAAALWPANRTNVGVAISSRVDINDLTMQRLLIQRLYLDLASLRQIKQADVQMLQSTYLRVLSDAKSAASADNSITHAGDFRTWGAPGDTEYFTISS